jgi:prefoldin subunit 5
MNTTQHTIEILKAQLVIITKRHNELQERGKTLTKKQKLLQKELNQHSNPESRPDHVQQARKRPLSPTDQQEEDQQHEEKKRKLNSVVVKPNGNESKKEEEEKKPHSTAKYTPKQMDIRNAAFRLFQSSFNQAKKDVLDASQNQRAKKKEDAERKAVEHAQLREKEMIEKELANVSKKIEDVNSHIVELRAHYRKIVQAILQLQVYQQEAFASHFLMTHTEPRIYFAPKKYTDTQLAQIEGQVKHSHEQMQTFNDTIPDLIKYKF